MPDTIQIIFHNTYSVYVKGTNVYETSFFLVCILSSNSSDDFALLETSKSTCPVVQAGVRSTRSRLRCSHG